MFVFHAFYHQQVMNVTSSHASPLTLDVDVPLVKGSEMHLLKKPAAHTSYNFIADRSTLTYTLLTKDALHTRIEFVLGLVQVSSKPGS